MEATPLTAATFRDRVYDYEKHPDGWRFEGTRPALIDFYASWCGPCRMLSPIVDKMAEEYSGRVDVYKVNVDEERRLAALFGIRSIPTLLLIPVEGEPTRLQGALPESALRAQIDRLIQPDK